MSSRSFFQKISVTWSETVGLRTRPQSETKQIDLGLKRRLLVLVLGLAGLVWCCVVKHDLVTLVVIMNDLEGHCNFSSTIYGISILCLEHHYYDQQWRSLT